MFEIIRGHRFVAEAKQCWPNIKSEGAIETLKNYIKLARKDSSRTPNYGSYKKLGLVFATPEIHRSGRDEIDACIMSFVERIKTELSNTACAWAFPSDRRYLESPNKKYIWPGAVVLIQPLRLSSPRKK